MKVLLILTAVLHLGWLQEAPEPFQIPNICTEMGPDQGSCGDYNVRWFFNPEDGQCKQFMYSGCGGNENNFKTLQDCEMMCKGGVQLSDGEQKPASEDEQTGASQLASNISEDQEELKQTEASEAMERAMAENEETTDNDDAKHDIPEQDNGGNEEDDEYLDDGEEDDDLINKYLNVGDQLDIEDSQMLKEAMAKFDVSVLKELNDEEVGVTDIEEQWNREHQEQQEPQQLEQQQQMQQQDQQHHEQQQELQQEDQHQQEQKRELQEQEQQLVVTHQHEEQSENKREEMRNMEEAGNLEQPKQEQQLQEMPAQEVKEAGQQTENNEERQGEHTDENVNEDYKGDKDNSDGVDDSDDDNGDDDDDDEFMDDNGKEVESFLAGLDGDIAPEDREMLIEGVARFGATMLKKPEEIDDSMEVIPYDDETPNDVRTMTGDEKKSQPETNGANKQPEEEKTDNGMATESSNVMPKEDSLSDKEDRNEPDRAAAVVDDHDDDNEEEAEGIDIDVEYPPIKGMISAEDRRTLAEAMNTFGVVEAIADGRRITEEAVARIPMMSSISTTTDDVNKSENFGVNENSHQEKEEEIQERNSDNSINTRDMEDMNAEDRKMLNELVSNYDVNVVEGNRANLGDEERVDASRSVGGENSDAEESKGIGLLSPRCTLPPITGPCRARKLRWFFDMETGACTTFVYGGCRGNGNRFPSREKCLASCLGERHQVFRSETPTTVNSGPMHKSGIPVMPTQSPTKKITFMMPLLSFLSKRVPSMPTASPSSRQQAMENNTPPRGFHPPTTLIGGEAVTVIRHASLGVKSRQEGSRPELGEPTNRNIRAPFSPLRYMIMRAMFKPASRNVRLGGGHPDHNKPTKVRIVMPWLQRPNVPSFQKPQPAAKPLSLRAPVDRTRMPLIGRGYSAIRDTLEDEHERVQTRGLFSPKMIRKSEFESMSHDNKHFNNVSPNNKFTLLQVFVNKHNGRQYFDDISRRTRLPVDLNNNIPTEARSSEPFNQAPKSLMYPMRYPYGHYPAGPWNGPMPHHSHQYAAPHGYPSQVARHPMPFSPMDSFGLLYKPQPPVAPPMPRRPVAVRPVLIASHGNTDRNPEEKSRYSCLLPLAPGRCKSYQTKWYYNRNSGKCEIFYYTGCAGNANNFETWEQCAAICLESANDQMSTVPPHLREKPGHDEEDLMGDSEQDTIIITSTRYPENAAEERQAIEDAKTESPSGDQQISSTTEKLEPEEKVEDATEEKNKYVNEEKDTDDNGEKNGDVTIEKNSEALHERHVIISEASAMSAHYIMLLAVITVVALAIIVLVSISIVHLCRKMRANKKERILEAVIKQHLSGEVPNVIYTTKPAVEQTDKSQA